MFTACLILLGCKKEGCTNSAATNYDKKAKEDNNTCEYDVFGLWNAVSYISGGIETIGYYNYITMDLRRDYTSRTITMGKTTGGGTPSAEHLARAIRQVDGSWTLEASNLRLTNSSGQTTIWTISAFDGTNMTIDSDDVAGQPTTIMFTR